MKTKMKQWVRKIKRAICFISDTHVGSVFAIMPKDFVAQKDDPQKATLIKLNFIQKHLLEHWQFCWDIADNWHVDTVICLSDMADGLNKKEYGANINMTSIDDQMDAIVDLIKPYAAGRIFHFISGSGYHESRDFKLHKGLADKLGGLFHGDVANVKIKDTDKVLNIAHEGGNAIINMASQLEQEGRFNLIASAQEKIPKADIIVRGHIHRYAHLDINGQHHLLVPCWKVWHKIKRTAGYAKQQPDIGMVIMLMDDKDRASFLHYLMPSTKRLLGQLRGI